MIKNIIIFIFKTFNHSFVLAEFLQCNYIFIFYNYSPSSEIL